MTIVVSSIIKAAVGTLVILLVNDCSRLLFVDAQGGGEVAATLAQKWNISEDVQFEYESTSVELTFQFSNFISNEGLGGGEGEEKMARLTLYDRYCRDGGNVVEANATSGIRDIIVNDESLDVPRPTDTSLQGVMGRNVYVNVTLDEDSITSNPVLYREYTDAGAVGNEIRFCILAALYAPDLSPPVEINSIETLVTLTVELSDGFNVGGIIVGLNDRLAKTANQIYNLEGYICDYNNNISTSVAGEALNVGSVVRVCVQPDSDARIDGIYMHSIDNFIWSRTTPYEIVQPAIVGRNKVAANSLTSLDCTPGSDLCWFETVLFSDFYSSSGDVSGSGIASLQFGSTDRTVVDEEPEDIYSIQPRSRDEVHAVWIYGPPPSGTLTAWWPQFGTGSARGGSQCDATDPNTKYTGYDTWNGAFCRSASGDLDTYPYLAMYSGKVGLVLDASGSGGNIFRQMGGTGNIASGYEATDVYASLASSTVTVTADLTCNEDGSLIRDETILASLPSGTFAEFGLVRQGHAVTHVTIDKLRWLTQSGDAFKSSDLCNSITPVQDPDHINDSPGYRCSSDYVDGVTSDSCLNPLYPVCQGYSNSGGTITWGSCYEHTDPIDTAYTNLCRMDYYEGFSPDPCSDPAYTCSLELGTCTAGAPTTNNQNCNQDFGAGNSFPCPEDYPTCVDFLQGVRWGKCYSSGDSTEACTQDFNGDGPCTDGDFPICKYDKCYRDMGSCSMSDPWFDLTIWGDTIAIEFNWDGTLGQSSNCDGTVELSVQTSSGTVTRSGSFSTESKLSVLLSGSDGSSSLTEETTGAGMEDVTVTSLSGGVVLERSNTGDVIMEVPTNTPSCSYSTCGSVAYLDVTASNSNADQARPVRLSLSRNFETGSSISQSRPGAEITGFTVMVLDSDTQQPNGIPVHISKNWHSGVGSSIYDGSWWTANMMFYLPPGESLDLTFVITHEIHQGVPQWSHAQLSLIGWAANGPWLWEESALGTGGENFVMDPHGAQRRSVITDVRPKLFDGQWKENVGGGDFLNYFDETGTMQYKKELDARLHVNGPCLSDATYDSISRDGKIKSMVQISGSRTNDLVRVFFHVRHTFVQDTSFSRLGFFMMGADTYNFASDWQDFVWGNEAGVTHNIPRTCSGGHSRDANKLYESVNSGQTIYRESLNGAGPWWFSFGPNTHSTTYGSNTQVVGDKGLVIRSFDARFGGVAVSNPSVSLLCDKIELGPPPSVSSFLAGDYVDMRLEFLVLPRDGAEFDVAQANQPGSTSLSYLGTLGSTWERVQAQATRGTTVTSVSAGGFIESHYPIRLIGPGGYNVSSEVFQFTVEGQGLGYVPIVVSNLVSSNIPSGYGLWSKKESESEFTLLTAETDARQVNYDRSTKTYELVFNVEILLTGNDQYTEFLLGLAPLVAPLSRRRALRSSSSSSGPNSSNKHNYKVEEQRGLQQLDDAVAAFAEFELDFSVAGGTQTSAGTSARKAANYIIVSTAILNVIAVAMFR